MTCTPLLPPSRPVGPRPIRASRVSLGAIIGLLVALALPLSAGVGAQVPAGTPHVVARPDNVMVNTTVTLTGTGFSPGATLDLRECGATTWIVPQNPCNATDVAVTTNRHGAFVQAFRVTLCPRSPGGRGHPVTEERCYVGVPTPSGIDVIDLVGHVKIVVTYP